MAHPMSIERFIEKAKFVHGDIYDYSKVEYKDSNQKVEIICKKHGSFFKSPKNFLDGFGCNICNKELRDKSALRDKFISKSIKKYGDAFDYSKVEYVNAFINVIITCKVHGDFIVQPANFLYGRGCSLCKRESKHAKEQIEKQNKFIEMARMVHGDKYDYSKSVFVRTDKPLIIICPKHGEFKQSPQRHLKNECNCRLCNIENSRSTLEEFIVKARLVHGNKYDYSKSIYRGSEQKIIIICPKHGEFKQTPSLHLSNKGCYKCNESKGEKLISTFLNSNNIIYVAQKRFDNCKNKHALPFDFWLPEKNILIEFDGKQHFESIPHWGGDKSLLETKNNDNIKNNWTRDNGIKLIRIHYKDINNIDKILTKELTIG